MARGSRFHEGELSAQARAGTSETAARTAAMLRGELAPAQRAFLSCLRTLAVGGEDERMRPWASLWIGDPGFVRSDDGRLVAIVNQALAERGDDPLYPLLLPGRAVGMLAIDLSSRRRLRINGAVTQRASGQVQVDVREVFPNCPKYIQRRRLTHRLDARPGRAKPPRRGRTLDDGARSILGRADTAFIASRHAERGLDLSHRGGERGFIHVLDDHTFRIPDYPGNGMFQTLGNLELDPRAGIVAVDFEGGRLLSLTGEARTVHGVGDGAHPTGGTDRYLRLVVDEWSCFSVEALLRFRFLEAWPQNPAARGAPSTSGALGEAV